MAEEAYKYCKKILKEVSRSFALSIPMLDDSLQKPVTIVYLQDRLLDNFEDEIPEDKISLEERFSLMDKVVELFRPDNDNFDDLAVEIAGYAGLMPEKSLQEMTGNALMIRKAYGELDDLVKELSFKWLKEMNLGMKKYLSREVKTFIDLDEYCYYVAGTVGGFLTDLLIYYSTIITEEKSESLLANFNASGQFLQKINLIRDIREDVKQRVKHYWPLVSLRISLQELIDEENKEAGLAALDRMIDDVKTHVPNLINYFLAIPEDKPGYRKFYSLNNALGLATIEEMDNNPAVLYGPERVKVDKSSFLKIMKDPEKAFLDRAWRYY